MAKQFCIGAPKSVPVYSNTTSTLSVTASNISTVFTVTNDSYYFVGSGSTFTTNNGGNHSTTAKTTLKALYDMTVSFTYSYSSETNYDKFTLVVGDTTVEDAVSGSTTTKTYSGTITAGQTIVFQYSKDSSQNSNSDKCTFSAMSVTYTSQTQTGTETRSVACNVKASWFGVDGKARKIKKMWIGVSGVAREFWASGISAGQVVLTSSGTWTVPAGVKVVDIFCVGGGGGGGGSYHYVSINTSGNGSITDCDGSAGGSGYTATVKNVAVTPGESLTITIGSGGSGGKGYYYEKNGSDVWTDGDASSSSGMSAGGAGGTTSVKRSSTTLCTASGGKGGVKSSSTYVNGANGGSGSHVGSSDKLTFSTKFTETAYTPEEVYVNNNGYLPTGTARDGDNGSKAAKFVDNDGSYSHSSFQYGTPGTGQGTTTRAFGESNGTEYSNAYVPNTWVPNSGNSGFLFATNVSAGNRPDGQSGVVIIRWAAQ